MTYLRKYGLAVAIGSTVLSCGQGTKPVEAPESSDDSGTTETPTAPVAKPAESGAYQCHLQVGADAPTTVPCSITKQQTLTIAATDLNLVAALQPVAFGFEMTGELTLGTSVHKVDAELFRQGEDSHAAVFVLPTGAVRVSVVPAATER